MRHSPPMAAVPGHDEEATQMLDRLLTAYRMAGLSGIRRTLLAADLTGPESDAVVTEAVYRLAIATSRATAGRRDWEHFEADEDAVEREQIEKGGNR